MTTSLGLPRRCMSFYTRCMRVSACPCSMALNDIGRQVACDRNQGRTCLEEGAIFAGCDASGASAVPVPLGTLTWGAHHLIIVQSVCCGSKTKEFSCAPCVPVSQTPCVCAPLKVHSDSRAVPAPFLRNVCAVPPPVGTALVGPLCPRDALEGGEVPPLLEGAQPMPSHCPPAAKCRLQRHL